MSLKTKRPPGRTGAIRQLWDEVDGLLFRARSRDFDLDNGAAATIDDAVMKFSKAVTIRAARIVYTGATSGTVAAGDAAVGSTLAGAEIVAATSYEDAKVIGSETAMTLIATKIAAGGALFVRHVGVAATQAGEAYVEIEYTID